MFIREVLFHNIMGQRTIGKLKNLQVQIFMMKREACIFIIGMHKERESEYLKNRLIFFKQFICENGWSINIGQPAKGTFNPL